VYGNPTPTPISANPDIALAVQRRLTSVTDAKLTTAQLSDELSGLDATFVPGAGMLCCSLRHRGEELLAQNAGVAAYAQYGKTMGIPLLYPWANRLAAFDYSVAGRTVQVPHDRSRIALDDNGLPIHGVIGGRLEWELTDTPGPDAGPGPDATPGFDTRSGPDLTPDPDARPGSDARSGPDATPRPDAQLLAATLTWSESEPQLFELFPFRHDLLYEARLVDRRLEIEVTVHACGADSVPLAFGFHPYLSPAGVPREQWLIELPAMRHLALDPNQIPVGPDQSPSAHRFELGARQFDDGFDSVVEPARFSVAAGDRRIEVDFLRGYPCAQVYAPLSGSFICFEPMTAPTNALRSGDGLRLLAPGERFRTGFSLRVEDLAA
jgi:aldose 1-epimerase